MPQCNVCHANYEGPRCPYHQLVPLSAPLPSLGQYETPMFLLAELSGEQSMSGWSGGHQSLSGSHHILPKSVLAWLHDHMTVTQRAFVKQRLFLPVNSGPLALSRLRSNLISPMLAGRTIRPEERWDDPHHRLSHAGPGLNFLDLVRDEDGGFEPRSQMYLWMALFIIRYLYPRFRREGRAFRLTNGEVEVLTALVTMAESLHYEFEPNPTLPAFSAAAIWVQDGASFGKGPAPVRELIFSNKMLVARYRLKKGREAAQRGAAVNARLQNLDRWFAWLGGDSDKQGGGGLSVQRIEDIKCDWIRGIPMFIHGSRRGRVFCPTLYGLRQFMRGGRGGEYKQTLLKIHDGSIDPDDVEWFNALFEHAHDL